MFPAQLPHEISDSIGTEAWKRCHLTDYPPHLNTLKPRQNGHYFPDDIFKCIILNENVGISINILLHFVNRGPINNIPALVQIMARHWPGDKPLSEPMMVILLPHICFTWSKWVYSLAPGRFEWNFRYEIFKFMLATGGWSIGFKTTRWKSLDVADDDSTLIQVVAWAIS